MHKRIDMHVGPTLAPAKLEATAICPCRYPVINPETPIGKEYKVDLRSVRWARFQCGGCGKKLEIRIVDVWDTEFMSVNWFFLDLLDIGHAIPQAPKPEKWQSVFKNQVAPPQAIPGVRNAS